MTNLAQQVKSIAVSPSVKKNVSLIVLQSYFEVATGLIVLIAALLINVVTAKYTMLGWLIHVVAVLYFNRRFYQGLVKPVSLSANSSQIRAQNVVQGMLLGMVTKLLIVMLGMALALKYTPIFAVKYVLIGFVLAVFLHFFTKPMAVRYGVAKAKKSTPLKAQ